MINDVKSNSKIDGMGAFKYIVVYENNSDRFDIGHCHTKVKATARLKIFLHLLQYKLSGPITQLWYKLGS